MIVFDLQCKNGHRFEGWFDDSPDFKAQMKKGLVLCPVCNDATVSRVPSVFGIRSDKSAEKAGDGGPSTQETGKVLFKKMAEYVRNNFDDVGSGFTTEALKIHYGVTEPRNIRGTSTPQEEDMLVKEGVPFSKFPVVTSDDTDA